MKYFAKISLWLSSIFSVLFLILFIKVIVVEGTTPQESPDNPLVQLMGVSILGIFTFLLPLAIFGYNQKSPISQEK